ncbi:hypothetical protein SEMRO_1058_G236420.1 [Seminavis robusta]|uniref:Uncharacterized protein n=1 Tax=Seminavis robusta TaxID=568900 RepID=A0A9N8EED4_9STRA|nr:hypothetical protein SEMRO_1058_G236420.1 [Seminavis robusta]|eukprot:Sro1058_g236420.1 n/a (496) ;mRNA; r:31358-32845
MTEETPTDDRRLSGIPYHVLGAVDPNAEHVGSTERYYKCGGEKAADLMAMGIGLKTFDLREVGNVDEEPYCSMKLKKKVTPTQKHFVDEIRRRCILDGLSEPKCGHWEKRKCLAWLRSHPLSNTNDRAFVIAEEKKLFDLVVKAKLEKEEDKKEKASPWVTPEPYIRMIECMLDDSIRGQFLEMHRLGERDELDARNSADRPETVYESCARLYNDKEHDVFSRCLPDLHFTFAEVLDCSFEHMPGAITSDEVKRRWGDCRAKLIKIIAKWELSGNGFGQRVEEDDAFGHLGEEELQCGDNRANFLDSQTKEHILYLWHVSDDQEILKNVMCVIADSCAASSEACSSVAASVNSSARKRKVDERALGFFRAKMSLAMHSMSRAAIWKELRETQEKLFESQLKVMKTKSATLSELYMGRIRMLEANVTAIQEGLDALDFEDKMDAISPKKRKKRKVVPTQVELPRGLIESGDEDSDVGDEDEDVDDEIAAASASIGY